MLVAQERKSRVSLSDGGMRRNSDVAIQNVFHPSSLSSILYSTVLLVEHEKPVRQYFLQTQLPVLRIDFLLKLRRVPVCTDLLLKLLAVNVIKSKRVTFVCIISNVC